MSAKDRNVACYFGFVALIAIVVGFVIHLDRPHCGCNPCACDPCVCGAK